MQEEGPFLSDPPMGLSTPLNKRADVATPEQGRVLATLWNHLCVSRRPNFPSAMGEGGMTRCQGSRGWEALEKGASERRPGGDGPPGPAPFAVFLQGQEGRHPPSVSRSSVSDPCAPDLASTQAGPWATSQGSWDRLFLAAACRLVVHCALTRPLPAPAGGEGWREEAPSHLNPASPGGFPSLVWALQPASFSSGGVGGGWPGPEAFPLPWNSSTGIT